MSHSLSSFSRFCRLRAPSGGSDGVYTETAVAYVVNLLGGGRSMPIFDEFDDIFAEGVVEPGFRHQRGSVSKQWLHTILETNPVPELGVMTNLTPGDFAVVARRLEALGHARQSPAALLAELRAEVAVKQGAPRATGSLR